MEPRDKESKQMGLRIYAGGTFDLFHAGHARFLQTCSKLGSVVVSLNTDEFIADYKGKPPVMTYQERLEVLASCRYVDRVIPNSAGADSKPSILQIMPDIIAIGSDWARKDYYGQMQFDQDWLDDNGISLLYIPYTAGVSSTDVKRRIRVN
jgi:glycerol-3-phosphate cytidylyltransferase